MTSRVLVRSNIDIWQARIDENVNPLVTAEIL